jgi:hypothetical protein
MTIHDHFDGSAHCVECKGICALGGEEAALTGFVREVCEFFALQGKAGWMPDGMQTKLSLLLAAGCWSQFWQRARTSMDPVRKLRRA